MTNQLSNDRYQEAMALHAAIMASGNTAAMALVEFSRLLKRMKDEKLYEAFDQTFDEYVEKQVGIKKRQAYTYIAAYERLGAPMMEQSAGLGITKLELLSQVSPLERDEVLENHDLGEMSTADVKKLVDELTHKGEQLDLFKQENEQLKAELEKANVWVAEKQGESSDHASNIAEYEEKIQNMKKEAADALRQAKIDAIKEQAKAVKEAVAVERQRMEKKAAGELDKAKKDASEEAEERARLRYEQADRNNEALREEIAQLKKKMSIAGNQDAAIVSAYCKTVLSKVLNELAEMIAGAKQRDPEQGVKLAKAAAGLLGSAKEQIEAMGEANGNG